MLKKTRVFFPLGKEYFMESPWVEIDGNRAFHPVEGQPKFMLKHKVKEFEQKGEAVIDTKMCIHDAYDSNPSKSGAMYGNGKMSYGTGQVVEHRQIELRLAANGVGEGIARIGLSDNLNLGIFGTGLTNTENIATVGGTFGAETLNVIGNLAFYGFLKIKKAHFEAGDDGVFSVTPKFKTFSHTGECIGDTNVYYPKAGKEDDNTQIRDMDEKYINDYGLDFVLNGKNILELPLPQSTSTDITLYTSFYPKCSC